MQIRFLTMESFDNRPLNSVGSSRIRGRWITKYLENAKEYTMGENPDVMVYQKVYWKEHMKSFKGLKIFDLCDPDWLQGAPVKEVSQYVDAFVVPTKALKKDLDKFIDKPVHIIKDRFDLDIFPKPKLHTGKATSAVWYGYSQNAISLESARSSLDEHDINLTIIADKPVPNLGKFVKYDWESIHQDIQEHDFVLMPNYKGNKFFKYKSNNKTIESYLLGMPVVTNEDELKKYLDYQKRNMFVNETYEKTAKKYDVQISAKKWDKLIKNYLN